MTSDPFQLFIIILLLAAFPSVAWVSGRLAEWIANGEEERVPTNLKWLMREESIEALRQGERKPKKWKLGVMVFGLSMPIAMLCSASSESFLSRVLVILAGGVVFLIVVILLEWVARPH